MFKRISGLLLTLIFATAALGETSPKEMNRSAALGLEGNVSRLWLQDSSNPFNFTNLATSYLHLNQHFHVGPTLNYSRYYTGSSSSTSYRLGVQAKWTLENIQTTMGTLFASAGAQQGFNKNDYAKGKEQGVTAALGYEAFLSNFVSLSNAVTFSRVWSESKLDLDEFGRHRFTSTNSSVSLNLGLNVYL